MRPHGPRAGPGRSAGARRPPRSEPTSRRDLPAGRHLGQVGAHPGDGVDLRLTDHRITDRERPRGWIRSSVTLRSSVKVSGVSRGVGTPVAQRERRGLPGHAELAVVVLHDAVEEQGQEAAVDQPGRTLVGDGEGDRPLRPLSDPPRSRTRGSTGCRPRCRRHGRGTPARRRMRPRPPGASRRPDTGSVRSALARSSAAMSTSTAGSSSSSASTRPVTLAQAARPCARSAATGRPRTSSVRSLAHATTGMGVELRRGRRPGRPCPTPCGAGTSTRRISAGNS